jgi:hypothetical protein
MLQPIIPQAATASLPMTGMIQSVVSAAEPVNKNEPGFSTQSEVPISTERLALAGRNEAGGALPGTEDSGQSFRELLAGLASRLDALADRPIEVNVTTTIDGRKVAEAVYKDLREKKIRNYETL